VSVCGADCVRILFFSSASPRVDDFTMLINGVPCRDECRHCWTGSLRRGCDWGGGRCAGVPTLSAPISEEVGCKLDVRLFRPRCPSRCRCLVHPRRQEAARRCSNGDDCFASRPRRDGPPGGAFSSGCRRGPVSHRTGVRRVFSILLLRSLALSGAAAATARHSLSLRVVNV